MAAEQVHFVYTGGGRDVIPREATHVTIQDSITVIPSFLFRRHKNIVELICHEGVLRIEHSAFFNCRRLKRVIIPGVKIIRGRAFCFCFALTYIECPQLEIIEEGAFCNCVSLSSINLQSVTFVESEALSETALSNATFGMNLESLGERTFRSCRSLERITLPLKDGLNLSYSTFTACSELNQVDLVERAALNNTIDALLMDKWRDDMNSEIAAINQSLPVANPGSINDFGGVLNEGEKARVIQEWIGRVLLKIVGYKAQHRRILEEAASTLQLVLPCDIVLNNIISFLELPPHTAIRERVKSQEDNYSVESQYSNESNDDDEEESQEDGH